MNGFPVELIARAPERDDSGSSDHQSDGSPAVGRDADGTRSG